MGRQRESGSSATWDIETTLLYCDLCINEIELGNRPTTHFSKEGWTNLTKNFNDCIGRSYNRTQLKNKWDQLKKDWKLWKDLMRGETGIGWNPLKKIIDASNEWWNEKIQTIPAAKKFSYNGIVPELEEKLDMMFSRVVVTGDDVWIPSSGVMPPELRESQRNSSDEIDTQEDEPQFSHPTGVEDITTSASRKSHSAFHSHNMKKRGEKSRYNGKHIILNQIDDLVEAAKSISDAITSSISVKKNITIIEALEEISKIPEIYEDIEFYDFATDFLQDKNRREMFMAVPTDRKLWWLRRRFVRNSF